MNSREKVLALLAQTETMTDQELEQAIPIAPAFMVRGALGFIAGEIPNDPAELDAFIGQVQGFCEQLKSDV